MNAADLIEPNTIIFDSSLVTKDQLLRSASRALADAGYAASESDLLQALLAREEEVSTGIIDGFGIPHAKSPCVNKPGLAFFHTGIMNDYLGLDDEPIQCAFVIVCPDGANEIHLDVLSKLARMLMDDAFRKLLFQANTSDEIISALAS